MSRGAHSGFKTAPSSVAVEKSSRAFAVARHKDERQLFDFSVRDLAVAQSEFKFPVQSVGRVA